MTQQHDETINRMEIQRNIETVVILSEAYRNLRGRKKPTEHRDNALDKLEELINSLIRNINFTTESENGNSNQS